jgi:phosphoserine phosphatase
MIAPTPAVHKQIADLETLLHQMIAEHVKMLQQTEKQQLAMEAMNRRAMDEATNLQEASRLRIASLEQKRRSLVIQIGKALRLTGEPKIPQLAEIFPDRKQALLKLREELRSLIGQVATKNHIVGKLAAAVLGHLNTAIRLVAGVVEHAGLYTRNGVPRMAARIGVMEAVG